MRVLHPRTPCLTHNVGLDQFLKQSFFYKSIYFGSKIRFELRRELVCILYVYGDCVKSVTD
jgi:hypothetical protein